MHVRWIAIVEEERKGCTGHSLRLKYFFILVRQCALCDPIVLIISVLVPQHPLRPPALLGLARPLRPLPRPLPGGHAAGVRAQARPQPARRVHGHRHHHYDPAPAATHVMAFYGSGTGSLACFDYYTSVSVYKLCCETLIRTIGRVITYKDSLGVDVFNPFLA